MNKKGVSAILATIIIILILLSLVTIIVMFSNDFLNKQKDPIKVLSPQYQKLKISIDSVAVNPPTNTNMTIIISRTDNEGGTIPLKGVRFKFTDTDGSSYTHDVNIAPIDTGESKEYTILDSDIGTTGFLSIKDVSVFGISLEGKQTQILDEKSLS
jgi:hypothetical protein